MLIGVLSALCFDRYWAQNGISVNPCVADVFFPDCMTYPVTGDRYASVRVPALLAVPRWTEFITSRTDFSTYPWPELQPLVDHDDGGARPGGPNAKGIAWEAPGNLASEVYDCPTNTVALTFDDGPILSDQTLDILNNFNTSATFFLIGSSILSSPNGKIIVQRVYDEGHQIALHTYTHRPISQQESDVFISEVIFNILTIYNIIGKVPRYFRPPYSAIDDRSRFILASMGLRPVVWNIDSLDSQIGFLNSTDNKIITEESVLNHIYDAFAQKFDRVYDYFPGEGVNPTRYTGFILLAHDTSTSGLNVTKQIIPWLLNQEYKLTTVNTCDRQIENADFYLEDDHQLVSFIRSIVLPLTDSDYSGNITDASGFSIAQENQGERQNSGLTSLGYISMSFLWSKLLLAFFLK